MIKLFHGNSPVRVIEVIIGDFTSDTICTIWNERKRCQWGKLGIDVEIWHGVLLYTVRGEKMLILKVIHIDNKVIRSTRRRGCEPNQLCLIDYKVLEVLEEDSSRICAVGLSTRLWWAVRSIRWRRRIKKSRSFQSEKMFAQVKLGGH